MGHACGTCLYCSRFCDRGEEVGDLGNFSYNRLAFLIGTAIDVTRA